MRVRNILTVLLQTILLASLSSAQIPEAPASPEPDARLKTDILVIVAHPDDDTLLVGYLARAIYDEHKRVAVVFATRGDTGQNFVGYEQAASLGLVREMEARRALASFGVLDVFFLDAPNTDAPDELGLGSLEKWPHGSTLEKTVRLIRLTRPEVVLTLLPDFVVGENHCDHQAAGVLATEAFDLAGDPVAYSEQVTPPADRLWFGNLTEGLQAWQPKKLYYASDTSREDFLKGAGPTYTTTDVSPTRRVPYYRMVAEENSFYLSQDEGFPAKRALAKGDLHNYQEPVRLIFGKSLVKSTITGDVFEGVEPGPIPFAPARGYQPESHQGLALQLGGPWAFYPQFWRAHNVERLARLHAPEVGFQGGSTLRAALLLRNDTDQPEEITLSVTLPAGWKEVRGRACYPVRAHSVYPVETTYETPAVPSDEWQTLTWNAEVSGRQMGSVSLRVFVAHSGISLWPIGVPRPE
jgi:LmbE family N-acetylglucosaminyl deacetylase